MVILSTKKPMMMGVRKPMLSKKMSEILVKI